VRREGGRCTESEEGGGQMYRVARFLEPDFALLLVSKFSLQCNFSKNSVCEEATRLRKRKF